MRGNFWNWLKVRVSSFLGLSRRRNNSVLKKIKEMSEKPQEVQKVLKVPKRFSKENLNKKVLRKKISKKTSKEKTLFKKVAKKSPLFDKYVDNPIISPNTKNRWESWQTFNPGAVSIGDRIHFLYRAIGQDGISRLGYANSKDGLKISQRHLEPAYEHILGLSKTPSFNVYSYSSGGSWGGCEDPRLVCIEEDGKVYVTYTACDNGLGVAITHINVDDFVNGNWKWKAPKVISKPGEVHKNWVIFPEKIKGKYAILHSINPEISIEYVDTLDFKEGEYIESKYGGGKPKETNWEKFVRGVGPPPLKTKDGWLVFYHAMDKDQSKYKVGAMILDLKNPKKILYRANTPILEPEEHYENNGSKPGIVYVSGAIVKKGELIIYYGGADSCVCVASANLNKFLRSLKENKKPKLKKISKKRK